MACVSTSVRMTFGSGWETDEWASAVVPGFNVRRAVVAACYRLELVAVAVTVGDAGIVVSAGAGRSAGCRND